MLYNVWSESLILWHSRTFWAYWVQIGSATIEFRTIWCYFPTVHLTSNLVIIFLNGGTSQFIILYYVHSYRLSKLIVCVYTLFLGTIHKKSLLLVPTVRVNNIIDEHWLLRYYFIKLLKCKLNMFLEYFYLMYNIKNK